MKMKLLNRIKTLMRKRISKILLAVVLCGVAAVLVSGAFKSDSEPTLESKLATVERGDLTVDITAAGNLALSVEEDLAFEIAGTVEEIMVEEGDSVEEGQVLATLDTAEWDEGLSALERGLLQAEINLDNAKLALENAEEETTTTFTGGIWGTTTDPKEIDIKELQVELAELALTDAQKTLEEALDASPEIIALFAGFITKVYVEGGDEVLKGTLAVQLADPSKFEADILVSEMDIFQVKLGGEAMVQADAMRELSFPAEVAHIAPTATIQSGVVNYAVKVELQPLETIMQEGEQAKQVPGAIPEDFQLREGLTVTVNIIVGERKNVLLVPNVAISTSGKQACVQVMSPDGTIEERIIATGISNWQYTEVTDGLSEGEEVLIPESGADTAMADEKQEAARVNPGGMPFHK